MPNLTISLDDHIIKAARVRAIKQGTSLSAKVREFLSNYASGVSDNADAAPASDLLGMMQRVRSEIQQNGGLVDPPATGKVALPKRSLRDEMYEGDFRARARAELEPYPQTVPGRVG